MEYIVIITAKTGMLKIIHLMVTTSKIMVGTPIDINIEQNLEIILLESIPIRIFISNIVELGLPPISSSITHIHR